MGHIHANGSISGVIVLDTHADVMALYLSSPAVSQIWALMVKPPSCTVRELNSTPMVVRLSWLNSFLVKRASRLLFPTPDSPIRTTTGKTKRSENTVIYIIY